MIPIIVGAVGLIIIIFCIYLFTKAGGALLRRRFHEAIEADIKTFAPKDEDE